MKKNEQIISLKVFAGAKKEHEEWDGGSARLFVREPAQRNMANSRVRELVAEHFGLPIGAVQIITGHRSPNKKLKIVL